MECPTGKDIGCNDATCQKTNEASSDGLKPKRWLRRFPLSFSRREEDFREPGETPLKSGLCNVSRGMWSWYQSVFLVVHGQCLFAYKTPEKTSSQPMWTLELVGAKLSVTSDKKFAIKKDKTRYWFKTETANECKEWLCAFQCVAGLYKKVTDFYEVGQTCGEGATCFVQECTHKLTGKTFALKTRRDPFDVIGIQGMYNELRVLQILKKHPHPAIPVLEDYFFDKTGDIKLVMEYLDGGELLTKIIEERCLKEEQARYFFRQIAEGILHLHQNCIAHRDIKPSNIMFHKNPDGKLHCKVIDYDLARENYAERWCAHNPCGTPEFMAPEIVLNKVYTLAIDVWSLGCVLYAMLAGHCPFRGANNCETRRNILENRLNMSDICRHTVSLEARDLIVRMLDPSPEKRLTIREVLAHPWLKPLQEGERV